MNSLIPYFVLLHRLRILEFIILLSVCIYSIHCVYNAGIGYCLPTNPQPIIRNEVLDLNQGKVIIKKYRL